jgi:hypothetical protein
MGYLLKWGGVVESKIVVKRRVVQVSNVTVRTSGGGWGGGGDPTPAIVFFLKYIIRVSGT